jgi:hypothetical protein
VSMKGFPQCTKANGEQVHFIVFSGSPLRGRTACGAEARCSPRSREDMDQSKPLACSECQREYERLCAFWAQVAADQEAAEKRRRTEDAEELQ